MVQALEQAINDEVTAIKRDVASDAKQLLDLVEAESGRQLRAMNASVKSLQSELKSIHELMDVIDSVKRTDNVAQLVRSFRLLHTSASDLIKQHRHHQQQIIEVGASDVLSARLAPKRRTPCIFWP